MSLISRVKTWASLQKLTATDLNAEYDNIINKLNNIDNGSQGVTQLLLAGSTYDVLNVNNLTGTNGLITCNANSVFAWGINYQGVVTAPKQPCVRVYRTSTSQSININTITKIQFNAKTFDVLTEFDATTNYQYTCTVAGKYLVNCQVESATAQQNDAVVLYIYKNGALDTGTSASYSATTNNRGVSVTTIVSLAISDTIDMRYLNVARADVLLPDNKNIYLCIYKLA